MAFHGHSLVLQGHMTWSICVKWFDVKVSALLIVVELFTLSVYNCGL